MLRLLASTRLLLPFGRLLAGSLLGLAVGACASTAEAPAVAGGSMCRWLIRTERADWQARELQDLLSRHGLILSELPVSSGALWWRISLRATASAPCEQQAGRLLGVPGLTDANPDQRASRPRPVRQP